MALGALAAVQELGKEAGKDVLIVSVDGLKEAIEHVIDGKIGAIAFNDPRFGAVIFDAVEKYAAGELVPPKIVVKGPVIDRTNAAMMLAEGF
jgi:ribose transport system substrate-binding protein